MKKLITARPEAGLSGFGSPYDPVLAGVAQGLASLFPPLESAHPAQGGGMAKAAGGPSTAARTGGSPGGGARG